MKKANFIIGTLSSGGAERVVSNITLNYNRDIETGIILYGDNAKIEYPYNGELIYLDFYSHSNIYKKAKAIIKRIKKVKGLKNSDITTISLLEYNNLLNLLTRRNGKTVISVRNHMSTKHKNGIKSRIWNLITRHLYSKADLIIAVSEEIKHDLIANYKINGVKIKVIYNSFDIKEIKRLSDEAIDNEYEDIFNKPVIITAGRLKGQKGHWHLIRAFFEVKKQVDAKLVILGEGDLKGYLTELAEDLGLKDDVYFLGFQNNPFKYIARSKVFVMSSLYEGFPNALAEAMACGVPVISGDCKSGPREILAPDEFEKEIIEYNTDKNRYGVLLPVCDGIKYRATDPITAQEKMMAKAMVELLKDKNKHSFYAGQAIKRVGDFDIDRIIKEWESVI